MCGWLQFSIVQGVSQHGNLRSCRKMDTRRELPQCIPEAQARPVNHLGARQAGGSCAAVTRQGTGTFRRGRQLLIRGDLQQHPGVKKSQRVFWNDDYAMSLTILRLSLGFAYNDA
jgi:hypothetical protein